MRYAEPNVPAHVAYEIQRLALDTLFGLVELSSVRLSSDHRSAELFVGRSCGEHCSNAWRVRARRANEAWRVDSVAWIPVPPM